MSVDHVLTIFSGKMPANLRNTHELLSFFECIVSVRDVQIRQLGKSMVVQAKCRTARSSSRKCLDHMASKPSTQTLMFPGRATVMCFRGRENAVALTRGEDRLSDSVTSVWRHRVLMKTYRTSNWRLSRCQIIQKTFDYVQHSGKGEWVCVKLKEVHWC